MVRPAFPSGASPVDGANSITCWPLQSQSGIAGMAPDGAFLCVGCLAARIGRELNAANFADALVNTDPDFT